MAKPTSRPLPHNAAAKTRQQAAKAATTPAAERAKKATAPTAPAAQRRPAARMVRATELTFYALKRRKPGEVFALRDPSDFRPSCMEDVAPGTKATPAPAPARPVNQRLKPNAADPDDAEGDTADDDNPLGV